MFGESCIYTIDESPIDDDDDENQTQEIPISEIESNIVFTKQEPQKLMIKPCMLSNECITKYTIQNNTTIFNGDVKQGITKQMG